MHRFLKTTWPGATLLLMLCPVLLAGREPALPQPPAIDLAWHYLLVDESYLLDDCPICDRVPIEEPMRGTFQLRLLESNPLFSDYALEEIDFKAVLPRTYTVRGRGTFQIGGEVAVIQRMTLQVQIDDGITTALYSLTNSTVPISRPWPMIDIALVQTNGTDTQTYHLRLATAPVREIWFSTINFFTAASGDLGSTFVMGGDLISTAGHVIKRNADLFTSVGAYPPGPDLGLDAVDILPGGEIAFSLKSGFPSMTLGPLQGGDLLSTRGRIIRRNQDLLAPFRLQPPTTDVGLDAAQVLDTGEILFSIETDVISKQLGVTLHRGDLLSSAGQILRGHQELLARFQPSNAAKDYGLDAFYIWPSGEIWFSTEQGFQDQLLGAVLAGDLLSDQGYRVFRNLELLNAFAPTQALPDYGLDALYIVTDAAPPAPAPRLSIAPKAETRGVGLTWQGQGRVFQVERAGLATGPFEPFSPIIPDLAFDDMGSLTNGAQGYYRLRQW